MYKWEYGNPEKILENKQRRTCRGCVHLERELLLEKNIFICKIGKQKSSEFVDQMKKCKKYAETKKDIF